MSSTRRRRRRKDTATAAAALIGFIWILIIHTTFLTKQHDASLVHHCTMNHRMGFLFVNADDDDDDEYVDDDRNDNDEEEYDDEENEEDDDNNDDDENEDEDDNDEDDNDEDDEDNEDENDIDEDDDNDNEDEEEENEENYETEEERIEIYNQLGHEWPPSNNEYIPQTQGWINMFQSRFRRLKKHVPAEKNRWIGYENLIHSALIAPNFTEYGWGLTRAPKHILDELLHELHSGLSQTETEEEYMDEWDLESEYPLYLPLMIDISSKLEQDALDAMHPIISSWSQTPKLIPDQAYGLRVYRNQSNLLMHVDKAETHVLSAILHVDHDPAGKPWPIVIEDLNGRTNEVFLKRGDVLLYESSKCFHGRPERFDGSWYSSLFLHFYPEDWRDDDDDDEASKTDRGRYRIPPNWGDDYDQHFDGVGDGDDVELAWRKVSFEEPSCFHGWCGLEDSLKWHGPAEGYGKVLTGDGVVRSLGLEQENKPETQPNGQYDEL